MQRNQNNFMTSILALRLTPALDWQQPILGLNNGEQKDVFELIY